MTSQVTMLAVIETSAGQAREQSLELLSAAREFGAERVEAIVVGLNVDGAARAVAGLGVERVYFADAEVLERYSTTGYEAAIGAAIEQCKPTIVLLAGTTAGRDLAPYMAAKRGQDCLTDCLSIRFDGDRVVGVRPVYQGKMIADVSIPAGSPTFISIRAGAFGQPEPSGRGEVIALEFDAASVPTPVKFVGLSQAKGGDTALEDADVVVVGGRGVGSAEQFQVILDLADVLGGAVGATRAATDLGWRPHFEQIGQTGAKIRPKLYVGVGVSGAVQHAVGMQNSETIVAINRDPDAPIFRLAEIGVIGDLHQILPHLITHLKTAKAS